MVIQNFVKFGSSLHLTDYLFLGLLISNCFINLRCTLAHRTERAQRIQNQSNTDLPELLHGEQRSLPKFCQVREDWNWDAGSEPSVIVQGVESFCENHVSTCFDIGPGTIDGGLQAFRSDGIRSGHYHELRRGPRVDRGLDAI